MEQPLRVYIIRLEERIQELRNLLTHSPAAELTRMQVELEVAELALTEYRAAYKLEQHLPALSVRSEPVKHYRYPEPS